MAKQRAIRQHKKQSCDSVLFEQYKIIVESAEKVSFKRQDANKFYLTVNSVLFGAASYLAILSAMLPPILISLAGIVTCWSWIRAISSHGQLNAAKFKIIHELEKQLPVALFDLENKYLKKEGYYLLTKAEKKIPWAFIVLHMVVIIIALVKSASIWWPWLQNIVSLLASFWNLK